MASTTVLLALVSLSSVGDLHALECSVYAGGSPAGATTCAAGITNCIKTKIGDEIAQGCDKTVDGSGGMTLCGAYPDVADGSCIYIGGAGQLMMCSTTNPVGAPAASDFASCPTTATCNAMYTAACMFGCGSCETSTASPTTSAPAGAAVVQCMDAVTSDASADGVGGTTSETSLATCTGKGEMCLKSSRRDDNNKKTKYFGLTQGCDYGVCSFYTDRNTCCTDEDSGTKRICITTNITSGVPTDSDFASCDTKCTLWVPVAVASLAADRTSGALKHMFITMFFIAVTAVGVYA